MELMTVGQLAKKADVNVETIRYYERRGLLDEPIRNTSGYRQYTSKYLDKIKFIKSAQSIGFTLNEIQDLLTLRITSNTVCNDVKLMAKEKILLIEEKINDLENIKNTLNELICSCENNKITDDCPILQSIKSK
jgi:Hg(II)-responsive transcriptional regulator